MTAKEYLMQLKWAYLRIEQKIRESADLKNTLTGRGVQYDSEHVQTSPQNVQENTIARYMDMEREIDELIDDYVDQKDHIINQIHELTDIRYMKILFDHYIPDDKGKVKSLEEISVEMHYAYKYTCDLHGAALVAFSGILRKNQE